MNTDEILGDRQALSPKEVAALLRDIDPTLNDSTVLRWCQKGKLEASKPFGRWMIKRATVAKLLVAFGIATAASLFQAQHLYIEHFFDARDYFLEQLKEQAIEEGWTFHLS